MLTKEDLGMWKQNEVTQAVNRAIETRIKDAFEEIVNSRNSDYDSHIKGMIVAFREVLDVSFEDIDEGDQIAN